MRTSLKKASAACLCVLTLAGCGTTPGDRGLSGGLLGAGTGAVIGSMAGSAGTGALLGGLGGAAIGILTSSDTINLGRPAWQSASYHRHKRASRVARSDSGCSTRETASQRITTCPK
ncbi:MAG TPA: hypothetical protein VHC40_12960 [Rhizomicrobium sp.]|jgi:hypothetical protein|nr:hypothetical protein [Rhizomicrobium sp.]